jgi:uncharacterized membrane protein
MKSNTLKYTIWAFILTVIPFGYLAYIWDTLPAQFVLNNGKANRIATKEQILENLINMAIVGLIIYFIMAYNKSIDPKQSTNQSRTLSAKFGLIFVVFMSALSVYCAHTSYKHDFNNFLFILTGVFLAATGNFMHSLPFRHPLGIRLPWVVNNEDIWRKTHQLASKIYFFTGLVMVILACIIEENRIDNMWWFAMSIPMLIPTVYSYRLS